MSEPSSAGGEGALPRFRVELESPEERIRRATQVHAGTMEEALAKVREGDGWPDAGPGSDPGRFRVVEAAEEGAEGEARRDRNARRRYLNTIVESGLTVLGKSVPERPHAEFSDVLCDFFTRAVVLPGHYPFTSGDEDGDGNRLLHQHGGAAVLAELLIKHLAGHGLTVTQAANDQA
ncbi:hypothetical protein [Streptomyces iconiensis]|uniref:Uncharacterized protein n=1 Tax=Streptomyces iconiensis TaxID=1384038 RepID=A0ABT7A0G4_9ACTN|nr:hypothetical protein [Streptomyces iconiensis]MDJ1134544.1 hypothetical protein [Streptomyces iconiensis]